MYKTFRTIFFEDVETAKRFTSLYGGSVQETKYFERNYFGDKVKNMFVVCDRFSNEEMDHMKSDIGLKERRWSGHKCYVYK